MKIVTVIGARPQFIKAAVVSQELRKKHTEVLVHTGQHFDYNMSGQFFEELDIPEPDYNLGISGGSHAAMTGKMMMGVEEVLLKEKPDWLLLYGDTNSTLAAALAAAKLYIPICHVEAGARTHCMTNPEEINRVCTDHVSALLLASTQSGMKEMEIEGLADRACLVGDPMYDAFIRYSRKKTLEEIEFKTLEGSTVKVPAEYYYLTCHREENTKDDKDLTEIFTAMERLDAPTVYPVHPRNKLRAMRLRKEQGFQNLILTEPVGYLESICLVNHAKKIVTDSGGLQREAFFAGKKCVTILDFVCWPETMVGNRNTLAAPKADDIQEKLAEEQTIEEGYQPFGDGHAGEKIVQKLEEF
ncbi:UDP-N-acetylglucosamine 2-epimerase (non-hydrolyzing) [Acetatifactor muris]|uniref:UDP-2,3-diacetamido-2,3-dideoxy-D-glucuronate 2-epimerase n=1 Tax=Acetatifactor muris TaxID=879566 RepID=A0A2K4ZJY3_9FIRM|nr:UDP-N-acetylglucosamine 2-epimerase (non-hydrolyzing) [Acetatifactor muris]MCR2049091.1 UDP-N-acetylglucosamine 2-epimerase (non-hydrolyzing) [Acetatifactor muris]SOY30765.1 UDP-2,3-diacetamido-2,3-dideoxy-D-glucuronate 2-epimerase [Acetatifactor muris]